MVSTRLALLSISAIAVSTLAPSVNGAALPPKASEVSGPVTVKVDPRQPADGPRYVASMSAGQRTLKRAKPKSGKKSNQRRSVRLPTRDHEHEHGHMDDHVRISPKYDPDHSQHWNYHQGYVNEDGHGHGYPDKRSHEHVHIHEHRNDAGQGDTVYRSRTTTKTYRPQSKIVEYKSGAPFIDINLARRDSRIKDAKLVEVDIERRHRDPYYEDGLALADIGVAVERRSHGDTHYDHDHEYDHDHDHDHEYDHDHDHEHDHDHDRTHDKRSSEEHRHEHEHEHEREDRHDHEHRHDHYERDVLGKDAPSVDPSVRASVSTSDRGDSTSEDRREGESKYADSHKTSGNGGRKNTHDDKGHKKAKKQSSSKSHAHKGDRLARAFGSSDGDDALVRRAPRDHSRASKRGLTESGVPGFVEVASPLFNSTLARSIAGLVFSANPDTSPNATSFLLGTSSTQSTQFYLAALSDPAFVTDATAAPTNIVTIRVPILNSETLSTTDFCATFDLAPPSPLSLLPCGPLPGFSQEFAYNTTTGELQPLYTVTSTAPLGLIENASDSMPTSDIAPVEDAAAADASDAADDSALSVSLFFVPASAYYQSPVDIETLLQAPPMPNVPAVPSISPCSASADAGESGCPMPESVDSAASTISMPASLAPMSMTGALQVVGTPATMVPLPASTAVALAPTPTSVVALATAALAALAPSTTTSMIAVPTTTPALSATSAGATISVAVTAAMDSDMPSASDSDSSDAVTTSTAAATTTTTTTTTSSDMTADVSSDAAAPATTGDAVITTGDNGDAADGDDDSAAGDMASSKRRMARW